MSTTTTKYGFMKPEKTDPADITAMNENWDKLDEALTKHTHDLTMTGHKITNVAEPQDGSDVATRHFVEQHTISGNTYVAVDYSNDGNVTIKPYVADIDELEFRDHTRNEQNPHKVTAEQTGAIGFKRELTIGDDLNNIIEDGIYVFSTDVVKNGLKNAPFKNAAVVEVFGSKSTTSQKIQRATRYGIHGESAWRALLDGKWSDWSRYAVANESADYPGHYYYKFNGEIEWINPPMLPGHEYRTTKKYWGNPIYVQCGFLTSLPNTNTTTFKLGEDKDVIIPIDFRVNIYDGGDENRIYPSPYFSSSGAIQCTHYKSDARTFTIRTFADLNGYSAAYWVEYIKGI